jgi:NADPH:quinone reductase-like Zn-dependent oxidoreductase
MRAIAQSQYGPPDVLQLTEIERPTVGDNDVLVQVYASAVHAGDWHLMRGEPWLVRLIFGGILKPKIKILGCDVAGRVAAVGSAITQFNVGDEVLGELSGCGFGAFAEYVCASEAALVLKPAALTFEQAATVPSSALAAFQGLRDLGQIQSGQRVLINGAASGVGSFAVQMAKVWGAEVTGVCGPQKIETVRSLGADHVIDYTQADFTQNRHSYDLILDIAAYRSVLICQRALTPVGTYVLVGGSIARLFQTMLLLGPWISKTSRRRVCVLSSQPNQADLLAICDLLARGQIVPLIDRCYSLSEVPEAIRYLEARQAQGKVAIKVI